MLYQGISLHTSDWSSEPAPSVTPYKHPIFVGHNVGDNKIQLTSIVPNLVFIGVFKHLRPEINRDPLRSKNPVIDWVF